MSSQKLALKNSYTPLFDNMHMDTIAMVTCETLC